jgi:uroporphyrin-III C-methyltransferase/precorrin-2 dehydrogenase/sirohydrochlorin ferrochelatase
MSDVHGSVVGRDAGVPAGRRASREAPSGVGRVWLVGAGPGDPDLLTRRAWRVLHLADSVLVDHLVPAALLAELDDDVEVVDVAKRPGAHVVPQSEINQMLVERGLAGRRVVRLKGGDPFVLGRGGEEALACLAAGVPVEVVPGITSVVSVPAAAGIPLTHRGITSSFVLASGHDGPAAVVAQVAQAPAGSTLVLLMATRTLGEITAALVAAGRDPATPAAIVERGWTAAQRTVVATLGDIAQVAERAGVGSPAVVVVGDVVTLREALGDLGRPGDDAGHVRPGLDVSRGVVADGVALPR